MERRRDARSLRGGVRSWRVGALVLLLAAACSGGTSDPDGGGDGTRPEGVPEGATVVSLEDRLEFEYEITGDPNWLTDGFGSMWVSRTDPGGDGNLLDRIDPESNEVTASIEVGRQPCHGVVADFDSVWVPLCQDQEIARVDPETEEVIARIPVPLPTTDGGLISAGEGALWIVSPSPDGPDGIARIHPEEERVEDILPLETPALQTAVGFGSVWVTSPEAGAVYRVDPVSTEVVATIGELAGPAEIAVGEDGIWVNEGDAGTIVRIDPASDSVAESISVGTPGGPNPIAVGDGEIWVRPSNYLLGRVDQAAGRISEVFVGEPALGDVHVAFGSVWFAGNAQGRVWRISL